MSKALKTVGIVVGVVALAATGIGLALGPVAAGAAAAGATASTFAGMTAATWATIGTVASITAGAISVASAVAFKPKVSAAGNPQSFTTNPQSGIPYCIGRTAMSGIRIHADVTDGFSGKTKNDVLAFAVLLSGGGKIDSIEGFAADKEVVSFNAATGAAVGRFANYMSQKVWLGGAMASALALMLGTAPMPGWASTHKLSGLTHALWMLRYDTDGDHYSAGVPEPKWVGKWVCVYDPRLDSTYPGGSGPCRALDESTYVWSRNPGLHALTWALGRWQNGKKTLGIGAPVSTIRIADFVECANVCEANGWWCGGVEYSTDSKWDILKRMLQAGGAVPTQTGAMIGCRVNTPRLPVATITGADMLDSLKMAVTKRRRDRYNAVIPRYRSEAHDWEVISGSQITKSDFLEADGGVRLKEIDYPLVQDEYQIAGVDGARQVGQLAAYDIANSREAGPISWTTGPKFIGLKTGDVVTLDVPDEGLVAQPVLLTGVTLDPSTGKISFTAETETESKHAWALGQSTTPPPAFALTAPDRTPPAPLAAEWTLTAYLGSDGVPFLRLASANQAVSWKEVLVQYRQVDGADWSIWGTTRADAAMRIDLTGLESNKQYLVRLAYKVADMGPWLELGPVLTDPLALPASSVVYDGGTPVEDLKPAQPGADVTGDHTAADTAAVGGKPSSTLLAELAAVRSQADTIHSELDAAVADIEATTGALQAQATAAASTIAAQGGEIDDLQQLTATQGASIASNAQAISNAAGNLATLTDRVETAESSVTSVSQALTQTNLQVASVQSDIATANSAISSNQQAISGLQSSVATVEQQVTAGSANLLPNGSFEKGLEGYSNINPYFSPSSGSGWGSHVVAYLPDNLSGYFVYFDSPQIAVEPSATLTVSADAALWTYAGEDSSIWFEVFEYGADGTAVTAHYTAGPRHYGQRNFGTGRVSATFTVGTGTASIRIRPVAASDSGHLRIVGWRQIKVERGAIATAYSSEASVSMLAGAMTTAEGKMAAYLRNVAAAGATKALLEMVADGTWSGINLLADGIFLSNDTARAVLEIVDGQATFNGRLNALGGLVVSNDGKMTMDLSSGRLVICDSNDVVRVLLGRPL